MVDRLRAVFAAVEKLSASEQELAAQELEEWLAEQDFDTFIASTQGQEFISDLQAEARQSEKDGTVIEGDWGD